MTIPKTIEIAIIDDNQLFASEVKDYITHIFFKQDFEFTIEVFDRSNPFLCSLNKHEYDLILLDIEMPEANGIDLSKQLSITEPKSRIIFLTSYQLYVFDAFGPNVIGYVLKNNYAVSLKVALQKWLAMLDSRDAKVPFKIGKHIILFNISDILCVIYEDRHPTLYTSKDSFVLSNMSMRDVMMKLQDFGFYRIYTDAIINMVHISSITKHEVNLKGYKHCIPISRSRRKPFDTAYLNFILKGEFYVD